MLNLSSLAQSFFLVSCFIIPLSPYIITIPDYPVLLLDVTEDKRPHDALWTILTLHTTRALSSFFVESSMIASHCNYHEWSITAHKLESRYMIEKTYVRFREQR